MHDWRLQDEYCHTVCSGVDGVFVGLMMDVQQHSLQGSLTGVTLACN